MIQEKVTGFAGLVAGLQWIYLVKAFKPSIGTSARFRGELPVPM